eukprot:TRINITY_DN55055_c0_g1_i1.p1 TRINITY_DN55055_c0_g1~~TRINITY_DN55055_c0_g1_i1.p1  ORF type:complete len:557 (+),score=27.76 TRINITY_DN55055_c0_g1_i1:220-1671(+)
MVMNKYSENKSFNVNFSYFRNKRTSSCETDNVLWLLGSADENNAFKFDKYSCYRLLLWSKTACSVQVRTVRGNADASKIIQEYKPHSLTHLVLSGHGSGDALQWGETGDNANDFLRTNHRASLVVLKTIRRAMQSKGTVLLDSCLAGTFHEEECLAHYISRMLGNRIQVIGSLYCFSADQIAVMRGRDVSYVADIQHGMRIFDHTDSALEQFVERDHAMYPRLEVGSWVRTFFKLSSGKMSQSTVLGKVINITGGMCAIDAVDTTASGNGTFIPTEVPCWFVLRHVKASESVVIRPSFEDARTKLGVFQGAIDDEDVRFRVASRNGEVELLNADEIWPAGQRPAVSGDLYAEPGDWVLFDHEGQDRRGVVVAELRYGPRVLYEDPVTKEAVQLDVRARHVMDVGKPKLRQRVRFYVYPKQHVAVPFAGQRAYAGASQPSVHDGELLAAVDSTQSIGTEFRIRDDADGQVRTVHAARIYGVLLD